MGAHTGPIRVYGSPKVRFLAPLLRPSASLCLQLAAVCALLGYGVLVNFHFRAAIALVAVVAGVWMTGWMARSTARHVLLADRFRWEQVDRACEAIVRHLPRASTLSRAEVRSAVQTARWDLACLMRDQARLMDLERATLRSAVGLAEDDPLRSELDVRRALVAERLHAIQAEVDRRLGRLTRLALNSTAIATEVAKRRRSRAAAERARRTLARVDTGIAEAAVSATRTDPAADFTERAEAILAAYRELSGERPSGPTPAPHPRGAGDAGA
ncbi:hypothetical protein [Micromonospora auratinigra]|uniref:Uncharacterized protein n=1 Tax=Micromonospora auratinigra TaxID=261654 RepID=A0A1A9A2K5_9ACTN|nr:hypothetical protein [Micromonospora auratinigra]SBT50398.1 hypothetical protein GA0070611_4760 [Micromonospora auratinigra]